MSGLNPVVEMAEYAIRHFAGKDVDRDTARKALVLWEGYEFISRATRDAVLDRFPEPQERVLNADFFDEPSAMAFGSSPALKAVGRHG